jgi:hypothetical protein
MRRITYLSIIVLLTILSSGHAFSQDLDALLEQETNNTTDYTIATFLGNRIINGHSTEQLQKNGLDFRISHRFGSFKEGVNELYGLDESNSYFSADYGLTNQLMIGIGRATFNKQVTGSIKAKLLRQSTGAKNMPVTVSLYGLVAASTQKYSNAERNDDFVSRLDYTAQILIARKFDNLSLQLSPTFVHRNLVETKEESNDLMALGIGGRYKITSVFDVSAEYFLVNQPKAMKGTCYNPLSFALSYQASHHVFQLILTNSNPISENMVIGNTLGSWLDGDIRIGFNISTVF